MPSSGMPCGAEQVFNIGYTGLSFCDTFEVPHLRPFVGMIVHKGEEVISTFPLEQEYVDSLRDQMSAVEEGVPPVSICRSFLICSPEDTPEGLVEADTWIRNAFTESDLGLAELNRAHLQQIFVLQTPFEVRIVTSRAKGVSEGVLSIRATKEHDGRTLRYGATCPVDFNWGFSYSSFFPSIAKTRFIVKTTSGPVLAVDWYQHIQWKGCPPSRLFLAAIEFPGIDAEEASVYAEAFIPPDFLGDEVTDRKGLSDFALASRGVPRDL